MTWHFDVLEDSFVVTPALVVIRGECGDAACAEDHWMISLSWLCWQVGVVI